MVRNKKLPSVMKHAFSQVPSAKIKRSGFDRSCGLKTTFNAGYLIPVFLDEVLPGDTFSLKESFLARMATPIFPLMDNLKMDTHYFFVPLRLVWDGFQKFCGEQDDPATFIDYETYLTPVMTAPAKGTNPTAAPDGGYATGSLEDYFGLPTHVPGYKHLAFFHRAYNLIWNEYFRDENLQKPLKVNKGDEEKDVTYGLLKRGKRYDYFTSCLPWPQKGNPVSISIAGAQGGKLPISGFCFEKTDSQTTWELDGAPGSSSRFFDSVGNPVTIGDPHQQQKGNYTYRSVSPRIYVHDATPTYPGSGYATTTVPPSLYVDLGKTAAVTINDLRTAFQIQRLLERDARGGTRYIEIIRSHFNVQSPDARLQRPEYLGGSSTSVNISPIPQTSSTDNTSPQGNLAAYGTAMGSKRVFTKSFTEHGIILGLASVRADLNYQQGLDRMWSRRTRWDFFWPALAHLGEQAVLNQEIYCQGTKTPAPAVGKGDEDVFGYQERFAEYRYKTSKITGFFRSNAKGADGKPATLDPWHLAQDFKELPTLSPDFIEENPPMTRVLALKEYPQFLLDGWFNLRCVRPMPIYSVPGLIDHF